MSRAIHGGYRQRPGGLGLAGLPAVKGPFTPRIRQILRLPDPFQTFHPKLVGTGVTLPIVCSEVNQNSDAPLTTIHVGETGTQRTPVDRLYLEQLAHVELGLNPDPILAFNEPVKHIVRTRSEVAG